MSVQVGIAGANVAAEDGTRLGAAAAARAAPACPLQLETQQRAGGGGIFFPVTHTVLVLMLLTSPCQPAQPSGLRLSLRPPNVRDYCVRLNSKPINAET